MKLSSQEWRLLLAGMLAMTAAFGTARFIYTPLLPLMQNALPDFSPVKAGELAAMNFLGYLLGSLLSMLVTDWRMKRALFLLSLLVASFTTAAMGMTTNETLWQVFRGLSGMASAGAIILGAALVMKSVAPIHTGLATGVYLSGTGAGIVLAGLLAEWFKPILSWQQLWMAAGGISLLLCLPALLSDVFPRTAPPRASTAQGLRGRGLSLLITLIFLAYFCAGLGYVVSATFLVAVLKAVEHLRAYGDLAWVLVGLAAAPSSIVWAALARRLGHFTALILAFVCQGIGVMMPVLSDSLLAAFLGAGLFGGTFLGIVSMVLNYSGRLSSEHPTRLVGLMTVAFGLGQILGPWGAGWLAEAQGNYNSSLLAASAVSFLGAVFIALSALSVRMMPLHAQPKMHTE